MKTALLLSVVLFLLVGCSDSPNAVGLKVIPPGDGLKIDSVTVYGTSDTTYLSRISGNSGSLLLGRYQDLESMCLLQYIGIPSTVPNAVIDTAMLTLRVNYRFKDSTGMFGFEVRRMERAWNQANFTWDSASLAGTYGDTVEGSYLQPIGIQDTVLNVRIDSLVQKWFREQNASPYGLVMIPAFGSTIAIGSPAPQLYIRYHDTTDTASLTLDPQQRIFVADGLPPPHNGRVTLQSGVAFRGVVRFDLLNLPNKVSITQAILSMGVDTVLSATNSFTNNNLAVYLQQSQNFPFDTTSFGTICSQVSVDSQKFFQSDIRNIVQQWNIHGVNYGIQLRAGGEFSSFDRFVLFGSSADSLHRPRIKIIYSILPLKK